MKVARSEKPQDHDMLTSQRLVKQAVHARCAVLRERLSEALIPLGLPDPPHVDDRPSGTWRCWLKESAETATRRIIKFARAYRAFLGG
jgi:hypothetical protein